MLMIGLVDMFVFMVIVGLGFMFVFMVIVGLVFMFVLCEDRLHHRFSTIRKPVLASR